MKSLYYIICLLSMFHLHAVKEKKLTTKLGCEYDLQLAQKQKAAESRKLAQVVVNKKIKANKSDQQKQETKKLEILKLDKNKLIKDELSGKLQHKPDLCLIFTAVVNVTSFYGCLLMYYNDPDICAGNRSY